MTKLDVSIYGLGFTIVGETEPQHIKRTAHYVDQKMRELASIFPEASTQKLAILAAINIADELIQSKEALAETGSNSSVIEEKTKKMISLIDKGLIGD
jgi:cell division protein ZapA